MSDFDQTSVGAALNEMRKFPTFCEPSVSTLHMASGDAMKAGVRTTRCLVCCRRIYLDEDGQWAALLPNPEARRD
jgi:hypothetical protein